jgi:hypothetical protein
VCGKEEFARVKYDGNVYGWWRVKRVQDLSTKEKLEEKYTDLDLCSEDCVIQAMHGIKAKEMERG